MGKAHLDYDIVVYSISVICSLLVMPEYNIRTFCITRLKRSLATGVFANRLESYAQERHKKRRSILTHHPLCLLVMISWALLPNAKRQECRPSLIPFG